MRLLEAGDADAFVYDTAIVQYLIAQGYSAQLAGPVLQPESYGIVLPEASPILEDIDRALLELNQNGTLRPARLGVLRLSDHPTVVIDLTGAVRGAGDVERGREGSVRGDEALTCDLVLGIAEQTIEMQRRDHTQQLGDLDTAQRRQAGRPAGVRRRGCSAVFGHDCPSTTTGPTLTVGSWSPRTSPGHIRRPGVDLGPCRSPSREWKLVSGGEFDASISDGSRHRGGGDRRVAKGVHALAAELGRDRSKRWRRHCPVTRRRHRRSTSAPGRSRSWCRRRRCGRGWCRWAPTVVASTATR